MGVRVGAEERELLVVGGDAGHEPEHTDQEEDRTHGQRQHVGQPPVRGALPVPVLSP